MNTLWAAIHGKRCALTVYPPPLYLNYFKYRPYYIFTIFTVMKAKPKKAEGRKASKPAQKKIKTQTKSAKEKIVLVNFKCTIAEREELRAVAVKKGFTLPDPDNKDKVIGNVSGLIKKTFLHH